MLRKPERGCAYPGCPRLTDGQYCGEHRKLVDSQNINIGFIIFCLYSWLCFETIDFTGIVQYHSCLYRLSCFVFIHVHTIQIRGTNWGIRGVTKRAVTMPPPAAITLSLNCPFPRCSCLPSYHTLIQIPGSLPYLSKLQYFVSSSALSE